MKFTDYTGRQVNIYPTQKGICVSFKRQGKTTMRTCYADASQSILEFVRDVREGKREIPFTLFASILANCTPQDIARAKRTPNPLSWKGAIEAAYREIGNGIVTGIMGTHGNTNVPYSLFWLWNKRNEGVYIFAETDGQYYIAQPIGFESSAAIATATEDELIDASLIVIATIKKS